MHPPKVIRVMKSIIRGQLKVTHLCFHRPVNSGIIAAPASDNNDTINVEIVPYMRAVNRATNEPFNYLITWHQIIMIMMFVRVYHFPSQVNRNLSQF